MSKVCAAMSACPIKPKQTTAGCPAAEYCNMYIGFEEIDFPTGTAKREDKDKYVKMEAIEFKVRHYIVDGDVEIELDAPCVSRRYSIVESQKNIPTIFEFDRLYEDLRLQIAREWGIDLTAIKERKEVVNMPEKSPECDRFYKDTKGDIHKRCDEMVECRQWYLDEENNRPVRYCDEW